MKRSLPRKKIASARKRASAERSLETFAPGECIRVVPLHSPPPVLSPTVRIRRKAPAPHLNYYGGALLTAVEVFAVFWGDEWNTSGVLKKLTADLESFFRDILSSSLIDQLSEYSVSGKTIGHGTFTGASVISDNLPSGSITDTALQKQLKAWIKAELIPTKGSNTLYFVFLPPGLVSIMGGSRSCQSYCGYHSNVDTLYYAVMPYPACSGCLGGMKTLDALTGTTSHELCEAITDPVPGKGWYDPVNGEIGDICAWHFKKIGAHTVQREWSNHAGKCL